MELFSMLVILILFGGGLYLFVSVKIQKSINDYTEQKLNDLILKSVYNHIKEIDHYNDLLDQKIVMIRNLLDGKVTEVPPISKKSVPQGPEEEKIGLSMSQSLGDEPKTTDDAVSQAFGMVGKALKNTLGFQEQQINVLEPTMPLGPKTNFRITGDPFDSVIRDETKVGADPNQFLRKITYFEEPDLKAYEARIDRVEISVTALLSELSPQATKIEKVVFLLDKGVPKEEISEALSMGMNEITLLGRIRLDRPKKET